MIVARFVSQFSVINCVKLLSTISLIKTSEKKLKPFINTFGLKTEYDKRID